MIFIPILIALAAFIEGVFCGESYGDGYWTPTTSTTVWWTPTTTSSWSYYTPYVVTTTIYSQQQGIITVTSLVPYPVTSILVSYVCNECNNNHPQTTVPVQVGTVVVTSYTTTTPCPAQTTTSNGFVYVVMDSGSYCNGGTPTQTTTAATASVQFQVINGVQRLHSNVGLFLACSLLLSVLFMT